MKNELLVTSLNKKFKKFEKDAKRIILRALEILGKKNVSAEIYLIDGRKMRFLNRKFRGKDKTTTVLSFEEPRNFVSPPSKHKKIGEIYINMSNVKCPALPAGRQKSKVYLIHGLLHLLGYNHKKKNDRIRMMKIERLLIKKLKN
ncbi:MAG: rRNA maturation RNase YbeY [Patescibacteria group bacterium]